MSEEQAQGCSSDVIVLLGLVLLLPGLCSLSLGVWIGNGTLLVLGCLCFGVAILTFVWLIRGKSRR